MEGAKLVARILELQTEGYDTQAIAKVLSVSAARVTRVLTRVQKRAKSPAEEEHIE